MTAHQIQPDLWSRFRAALGIPAPAPRRPAAVPWERFKGPAGRELIRRAQAGEARLKNDLATAHEGFIRSTAKPYYRSRSWLEDDVLAAGREGFAYCLAEKYDPDLGFELSTYVAHWIRHYIERYLSNHARTIRIPCHALDKAAEAERLGARTAEEAVALTGAWSAGEAWDMRAGTLSLDAPLTRETETASTLGDVCAAEGASPEEGAMLAERRAAVRRALRRLPARERKILLRRFEGDETLKEIGTSLGLSRERIRQIEGVALAAMRRELGGTAL